MRATMNDRGFTIVELLVVITIIVVLLALLTPAMDQAIYQSELAQCSGNLRAVGAAAAVYAANSGRRYPARSLPRRASGDGTDKFITPKLLARTLYGYDMRPPVANLLDINDNLRCPLTLPVDLEVFGPARAVETSYTMWWGWMYEPAGGPLKGMLRLGDGWEWIEGGTSRTYRILAGDYDNYFPGEGVQASHPDRLNLLYQFAVEDEPGLGDLWTGTQWRTPWRVPPDSLPVERGLMDMNHVFDDLSVRRYNDVIGQHVPAAERDERMARVPLQSFDQQKAKRFQVPKQ